MSTCEQSNKCKYRMNITSKRESTPRFTEVQPQYVVYVVLPRPLQDLLSLFAIHLFTLFLGKTHVAFLWYRSCVCGLIFFIYYFSSSYCQLHEGVILA